MANNSIVSDIVIKQWFIRMRDVKEQYMYWWLLFVGCYCGFAWLLLWFCMAVVTVWYSENVATVIYLLFYEGF